MRSAQFAMLRVPTWIFCSGFLVGQIAVYILLLNMLQVPLFFLIIERRMRHLQRLNVWRGLPSIQTPSFVAVCSTVNLWEVLNSGWEFWIHARRCGLY